jgi:hypothetical protein
VGSRKSAGARFDRDELGIDPEEDDEDCEDEEDSEEEEESEDASVSL